MRRQKLWNEWQQALADDNATYVLYDPEILCVSESEIMQVMLR
jgi:hypothetical protein